MSLSDELTRKVGLRERKDFAALNDPDAISGSACDRPHSSFDCLALYPAAAAFVFARSFISPFRPSAKRKRFLFAFIQNADRRQILVNGRTNGFDQGSVKRITRDSTDERRPIGLEAKIALTTVTRPIDRIEDLKWPQHDLKISWVVALALSLLSKFPALSVHAANRDPQCHRSSSSCQSRQSAFSTSSSSFAMTSRPKTMSAQPMS